MHEAASRSGGGLEELADRALNANRLLQLFAAGNRWEDELLLLRRKFEQTKRPDVILACLAAAFCLKRDEKLLRSNLGRKSGKL